jgi:isoamylase
MDDSQRSTHKEAIAGGSECRSRASRFKVSPGHAAPLGVQDCLDGFNFAVFSRHAERIELLLFEDTRSATPVLIVDLSHAGHRTGDVWHALVAGVRWGQPYAYRASGPWSPRKGHRFDSTKLLVEPRALAISLPDDCGEAGYPNSPAARPAITDMRSLVVERRFDWQHVLRPRTPWPETVIYETHVRGPTMHASAAVANPGTFLAVLEKIPHFLALGVTAVEFMPVQAFDVRCGLRHEADADVSRRNYCGYDTIAFFAPHGPYATRQGNGDEVHEFKTMVRELHRARVEVILDMVFNHTAEEGEGGTTFCFLGLDNAIYYMLDEPQGSYRNFSGCGTR